MTTTAAMHNLTGVLGDVANLLILKEQEWHDNGWDENQPAFWRVDRAGSLYSLDECRLGGMTSPDAQPRDDLYRLAHTADRPLWGAVIALKYPEAPVAHMLLFEGWLNFNFKSKAERLADSRHLEDIPGSLECRNGVALVGKRAVALNRVRDQEPELHVDGEGGYRLGFEGMYKSLRQLHVATMKAYRGCC